MMHGPCSDMNPENICMKNGQCKSHYPKDFEPITRTSKESYPLYRPRNNRQTVKISGQVLDNRWVVPYNPYLLAKYVCHINIEICSTIKAVKYLYKYIYKGHDMVGFHITSENEIVDIDEIQRFQSARWMASLEAVWRIYGFSWNYMYPPVYHLQVHLENHQFVTFNKTDDLNSLLQKCTATRKMLTDFFCNELNQ